MSILLVDLPLDEVIGLDFGFFKANNSICGMVELTPGAHYLYLTKDDVRYGNFVHLSEGQIIVLQASKKLGVAFEQCNEAERYIFGFNRGDFNNNLGRLSSDIVKPWSTLTEFINKETIEKLQPIDHGTVVSSSVSDPVTETLDSAIIYYTEIPNIRFGIKHNNDVTSIGMDKTWALEHMLSEYELVDGERNKQGFRLVEYKDRPYMYIIAELQFAFASLLMGYSYESLVQWKELFKLICNCDTGLNKYPEFFIAFGKSAYYQMAQLPEKEDLDMDNFLISCISNFKEIINSTENVDERILKTMQNLEKMVKTKFGVNLEDACEDKPTVVE